MDAGPCLGYRLYICTLRRREIVGRFLGLNQKRVLNLKNRGGRTRFYPPKKNHEIYRGFEPVFLETPK